MSGCQCCVCSMVHGSCSVATWYDMPLLPACPVLQVQCTNSLELLASLLMLPKHIRSLQVGRATDRLLLLLLLLLAAVLHAALDSCRSLSRQTPGPIHAMACTGAALILLQGSVCPLRLQVQPCAGWQHQLCVHLPWQCNPPAPYHSQPAALSQPAGAARADLATTAS
jgi:hypothetical protein